MSNHFDGPAFGNLSYNNQWVNNPTPHSTSSDQRRSTPSPLHAQRQGNSHELNDISPSSQDGFYANSGHTPLNGPSNGPNGQNFTADTQCTSTQQQIHPGMERAGQPHEFGGTHNNVQPLSHQTQGGLNNPNPPSGISQYASPPNPAPNRASPVAAEQPLENYAGDVEMEHDRPGGRGIALRDRVFLHHAKTVTTKAVAKPMRLGRATVMCLIFNRMIGTGIFRTPATVYNFTQSIGHSMAWWALGAVSAVSGIVVYMELAHVIPVYQIGGRFFSVPRNGGELNYLKYLYRRPAFFTVCVFGISFILLGHVAMNAIAFAIAVLDASGKGNIKKHEEVVRAIALCVTACACLLHAIWRQGGIYLNNILAVFKVLVLVLMFLLGMSALGGAFPRAAETALRPEIAKLKSTVLYSPDAYGYAESFLAILFAFGGLNQANYVIGEVDDPRKRYKWPAFSAVVVVSALYLLVNWAHFIVVPTELFIPGSQQNVAHYLFRFTLGSLNPEWEVRAPQMLSAFVAISALGNIIVMTYNAARVKQEIAKEGILPFRKFLGEAKQTLSIPIRKLWFSKKGTLAEEVPIGALILHFLVSCILIFATWSVPVTKTYSVLVDLYSYTIDAIFGTFLAFGLIKERFFRPMKNWKEYVMNSGFHIPGYFSFPAAFLFGISNLYPIATKWVPPLNDAVKKSLIVPFWLTGTVAFVIILFGILWWIGYRYIMPRVGLNHVGHSLIITRILYFKDEDGYKVLEFEDVDYDWRIRENNDDGTFVETEHIREETIFANQRDVDDRYNRVFARQEERRSLDHEGGRSGWELPHVHWPHRRQNALHEMQAPGSTPRIG